MPYPAFRRVNSEPGGGKPSPYDDKDAVNSEGELAVATSGSHNLRHGSNG